MSVQPNLWHLLDVGQLTTGAVLAGDGEALKYGVIDTPEECGCTPETPCHTMSLYFAHRSLPGALQVGRYRMRVNAFGILEIQQAEATA